MHLLVAVVASYYTMTLKFSELFRMADCTATPVGIALRPFEYKD